VLAALRPPALRVWAAAIAVLPLLPGGASASAERLVCDVRGEDPVLVADVRQRCEAAVPMVTGFWPSWQRHVTVVVARDVSQLEAMLPGTGDLTDIAALATDGVFVNPAAYASLSPAGRQVVMTHEVTHVATRGVAVPGWLAEGFAEQVANADGAIPLEAAAQELAAAVRAGNVPEALTGGAVTAVDYEQAWRAVDLVARTYGREALVRWYRAGGDPAVLGTTSDALRQAWRDDLHRTFALVDVSGHSSGP